VIVWGVVIAAVSLVAGLASELTIVRLAADASRDYPQRIRGGHLPGDGYGLAHAERAGVKTLYGGWVSGPMVTEYRSLTVDQWRQRIMDCLEGARELDYTQFSVRFEAGDLPTSDMASVRMECAGWPLHCCYSLSVEFIPVVSGGGPRVVASTDDRGVFPFVKGEMLWRPLAINTALLALPWALLTAAATLSFFAVRRLRRTRKSRCPACNYDRAGIAKDAVCPECGKLT
jgi:hypothetical protein